MIGANRMIFHKNWDNSSWCVFTLKGESCLSVRSQLMPISLLVTIWEQKEILLLGSTNVTLTGSKLLLCTCSSVLLLWLEVHTNNKVTLLCRALVALDMLGKLYLMTWYQSWNFIVSHMKFNRICAPMNILKWLRDQGCCFALTPLFCCFW